MKTIKTKKELLELLSQAGELKVLKVMDIGGNVYTVYSKNGVCFSIKI